jgi:uncharacterized coiled-coil DUF342 family protein
LRELTRSELDVSEIKTDVREVKESVRSLNSKVDTIAETVMTNDRRLTAVEAGIDDLRDRAH